MGYLRKNSFLIFSDEGAPTEVKELDPQKIAEIEAAHEAGKKERVDSLIRRTLNVTIPTVTPEGESGYEEADGELEAELTELDELSGEEIFLEDLDEALELFADSFPARSGKVTEEDVKAAEAAAREKEAGPEGQLLRKIVQGVQAVGSDEPTLRKYIRENSKLNGQGDFHLRQFAWAVFEIQTSKAALPDTRYRPYRTGEATVRFKDGGASRLGVNEVGSRTKWDGSKGEYVDLGETAKIHSQGPTLWVKVADGAWSKDGNWGGYLRVTCRTENGQWIDSRDGWVKLVSAKVDKVTFYDMGNYYEIWQKDRETGRPLTLTSDGLLRFNHGATPGKFNLQDSTWD
ncbi:hypothetical protein [Streptomyces sp. NPDC059564]|uniref:hypothetical protein n=1 Tax=Streptomyces sp. NPDC059564 TaxID=3346865 RepID=UPI00369BE7DB